MYLSWQILIWIAALISTTVAGVIPTSDGNHFNEESDLITSIQQELVAHGAAPKIEEVTKLAVATALGERSIDASIEASSRDTDTMVIGSNPVTDVVRESPESMNDPQSYDVIVRDLDGSGVANITMESLDKRSIDWIWDISGFSRKMICCVSTLPLFDLQQMQSGMAD
ncbi:hypothetical protein CGCTS75_v005704 [Colletotrichum tropicale]|nr:hypothetical protein CGCTS75_v005704 [Colletotrichum tropicale]